jgi:hypothetical protein
MNTGLQFQFVRFATFVCVAVALTLFAVTSPLAA